MKYLTLILFTFLIGCTSSESLIQTDSTAGWKTENGGTWTVKNGILYGEKKASNPKHALLISDNEYANFKLTMEYKAINGNSGFYFRLAPEKNAVGYKGYHAEIDTNGTNAGGLYDLAVAWMNKPDPKLAAKAFKKDEWNFMEIIAVGEQIDISLNGIKMTSLKAQRSSKGKLGIQLHSNENTKIKFRNIQIIKL